MNLNKFKSQHKLNIYIHFHSKIYKFTQGNLGAKKIGKRRFQSPVKKKNCDIGDRQRDP